MYVNLKVFIAMKLEYLRGFIGGKVFGRCFIGGKWLEISHGQKCETVTLLFIYSMGLFEYIVDQYGAVILL